MFSLFVYIDLVSIQKEIGETKIHHRGPKWRKSKLSVKPHCITFTNGMAKIFVSLKWSFTNVLAKKIFEIGALVSELKMSNFGSWNVTKYCAHVRNLANTNDIYTLVSRSEMSKFGSVNVTKHCAMFRVVQCFATL